MKQSNQLFFAGAVVALLLVGTYALVIVPANRKRDAFQADTERKLAAITRFNESADGTTATTSRIADLHQSIARFESKIAPAVQMNQVAETIWRLAEANALQTRSLKSSTGKRVGNYFAQEMDFSLAGGFFGFQQFTLQLEQLPAAVRVEKITLNRVGGRDGDMQVEMTLCLLLQPKRVDE